MATYGKTEIDLSSFQIIIHSNRSIGSQGSSNSVKMSSYKMNAFEHSCVINTQKC